MAAFVQRISSTRAGAGHYHHLPFCDSSHYPRPLVDNFSSCQGQPGAETWIQSKAKLKRTLWQVDEIKCNSGVGPSNRHEHIVQDFIMRTLPATSDMLTWLGNQQKDFFLRQRRKKKEMCSYFRNNSDLKTLTVTGCTVKDMTDTLFVSALIWQNCSATKDNKKKLKWVYNFDAKPSFNLVFRLFFPNQCGR